MNPPIDHLTHPSTSLIHMSLGNHIMELAVVQVRYNLEKDDGGDMNIVNLCVYIPPST